MSKAELLEELARPAMRSASEVAGKLFDELRATRSLSTFNPSKDGQEAKSLASLVFSPAEDMRIRRGEQIPTFSLARSENVGERDPQKLWVPKIDLRAADQLGLPEGFNYSNLRNAIVQVRGRFGSGTGFFTADGLVATNLHVVRHHTNGLVDLTHADGTMTKGKVIALSLTDDLALLKTEQKLSSPAAIELGSSQHLSQDDRLFAIGHPGGTRYQTLTSGEFSRIADQPTEVIRDGGYKFDTEQVLLNSNMRNWPGYSGSPIFKDRAAVSIIAGRDMLGTYGPTAEHLRTLSEVLRKEGAPEHGFLSVVTTSSNYSRAGEGLNIEVLHTRAAESSELS